MKTLFLLIFLGLGGNIFVPAHAKSKPRGGQNYYVDAQNGDDRADGKSEKTAWKSLLRTKELQLRAGDSLLLRRNSSFNGLLEVSAEGKAGRPVVIGAYGTGRKPCIQAPDSSLYTVLVRNSDYLTLENLEVVNTGKQRMANRTGVKVLCEDYGVSHDIVLRALHIHDVNGSLIKQKGGVRAYLLSTGVKIRPRRSTDYGWKTASSGSVNETASSGPVTATANIGIPIPVPSYAKT